METLDIKAVIANIENFKSRKNLSAYIESLPQTFKDSHRSQIIKSIKKVHEYAER